MLQEQLMITYIENLDSLVLEPKYPIKAFSIISLSLSVDRLVKPSIQGFLHHLPLSLLRDRLLNQSVQSFLHHLPISVDRLSNQGIHRIPLPITHHIQWSLSLSLDLLHELGF